MQIYFYCVSILFFIWIIRNIAFWTSLWQIKEYRIARLAAHIKETVQGRDLLFSYFSFAKWALLLSYGIVVFNDKVTSFYQIVVGLIYIAEAVIVFNEIKQRRLKRPIITPKAIAIAFVTGIAIIALFIVPITDSYLWMLILDRIVVVIVSVCVFFFAFPTEILRDITIQRATNKIRTNKKLYTIAVSGSYGKSSTKEFISQILEDEYNIVKTENSINTPIGVAHTILSKVSEVTDIFVVEMGTDKRGDNEEICRMVSPHMSVTTAVSDQHLSIFGNIENIYETEMELIRALPKDGISLFNGNSAGAYKLYRKTKKRRFLYECNNNRENTADIIATNILVKQDEIQFTLVYEDKSTIMKAPLLGAHVVENILPAIFIGRFMNIPLSTIKKTIARLSPPPKTMTKIIHRGIHLIDDTFNASPESVLAAANYITIYPKKKIIVLMPLIELGTNAKKRHFEIGEQLGKVCDYLFLTNNNFYTEIMSGMNSTESKCKLFVATPAEIAKQLKSFVKKNDIILFEGKEAGIVLKKLI